MKKAVSILLTAALLALCLPALAEGAYLPAPENMPDAMIAFFSQPSFSGYTVGYGAWTECAFPVNGSWQGYAFAVAQKNGYNVLYGFRDSGQGYRHFLTTDSAVPQGEGSFRLSLATGLSMNHMSFTDETICIAYRKAGNEEFDNLELFYSGNSSGVFNLTYLCARDFNTQYTEARAQTDGVTFYREAAVLGSAYGVLETNLRYFSWDAFPRSLSEAREKLSNPPDIPSGDLTARRVRFTGGQKFDVYTGPGLYYVRSGNGRASVSTNDWIQVFGTENGYVMIQYDISSTQLRIGWIDQSALPASSSVDALRFAYEEREIADSVSLTDDPLSSKSGIRFLQAGQRVTYLASMGNWAYVEVSDGVLPLRGFVPSASLKAADDLQTLTGQFASLEYSASAAVWKQNDACYAQARVKGPAAWKIANSDRVTGYQVYANNLPVDASVTEQREAESEAFETLFTLSFPLPSGAQVLGLCPVREKSGLRADEMIVIHLDAIK